MTRPAVSHPARPAPAGEWPARVLVLAVLAAAGVGALWFGLAIATGLIFHFLPGATFLAGAWTYRWREGGGRVPWPHVTTVLVAGAVAAGAAGLALAAAARPFDDPAVTAAVTASGALLAAVWLRWPGA